MAETIIENLYKEYSHELYRFAVGLTGDVDEANDIVQNIFTRLFNQADSSLVNISKTYLYTAVRNGAKDFWKRRHPVPLSQLVIDDDEMGSYDFEILDEAPSVEEQLAVDFAMETVFEAMKSLTEEQRSVLTAKYFSGLSNAEVSILLGKTENAVRQIEFRALRRLHSILQKQQNWNMENENKEKIVEEIMQAIESGVPFSELKKHFPEEGKIISELKITRDILIKTAIKLTSPVTELKPTRLKTEGFVLIPYINKLTSSMNYKIAVPVLVFGLVAVSGSVFLFGQKETPNVSVEQTETETTETSKSDDTSTTVNENTVEDVAQPTEAPKKTTPVSNPTKPSEPPVADPALDSIVVGFETDATAEQTQVADDGVTDDMFAVEGLSDFEIDDYVY